MKTTRLAVLAMIILLAAPLPAMARHGGWGGGRSGWHAGGHGRHWGGRGWRRGRYRHGGRIHRWGFGRGGWLSFPGLYYPYSYYPYSYYPYNYYPYMYYPYTNTYSPPTVEQGYPPVVAQQGPPPPGKSNAMPGTPTPQYWYYCAASKGYYPYVSSCSGGWQKVPATPPDAAQ